MESEPEEKEKRLSFDTKPTEDTKTDQINQTEPIEQSDEAERTKRGENDKNDKIESTDDGEEEPRPEDIYDDDDDYLEFSDYELISKYDKDWGEEDIKTVSSVTVDWEKEAKETVRLDTTALRERRRTIFELDSYVSSGPSAGDIEKLASKDFTPPSPRKEIRYSVSLGAPGIARINLSPLTQKVVGCVVGENVSTEYPWVYVRKEIIEDNIDLHEESSDFLAVKDEISRFPNTKILIGYVPSLTAEGQFYICLTEEGRDAVIEHIQKQRVEHENRVRTAVYKPLGEWMDLTSSTEIEASIVKKTRPLLEIEVIGTADVLNVQLNLVDRRVEDVRDGYIELLPYRQTFENVSRKLLYNDTQVSPIVRNVKTQTVLSVPRNCWVQYEYTYESPDIASFTEEKLESLKGFLNRFTDHVCDQLMVNATWDIYDHDYEKLVRNVRDTQWPIPVSYREHLSFHDEKHVVNKVINDLCWHPLWSGIAFSAYTSYGKSQHLAGPKSDAEVVKACENNFVLVWSFNDCLSPKLVLECPREVTSVAVNQLDSNLVVGGCANGQLSIGGKLVSRANPDERIQLQIVIWHIPGKIEKVEAVIVQTAAQLRHRITIKSLTTWMQEIVGTSIVRPTAMSSLKDSQRAAVTRVTWISPYDKLDITGRIVSLPEDTPVDDLSSQFITASEDGTIAFWDLKLERWQSYEKKVRKKKGQVKRPEGLEQAISPFKKLDRVFKPHYVLKVQHPHESRNVVITTITVHVHELEKERIDVTPAEADVTIRRFFRNVVKKPEIEMKPIIHVGTVEGDFGCVTWEGYDFTTDLAINSETCDWIWFNKVHDGPITGCVRSKQDGRWIATIGGKVFAIWRDDIGIPLIWKKSDVSFTAVTWGSLRPTLLLLSRMDGSVEIWDFMIKSEEPCVTQSLSGRIITGIYSHDLSVDPQCVGFCDFNGILRLFLAPAVFLRTDDPTMDWMENFIDRQIERVKNCKAWTEKWLENQKEIEEKMRLAKDAEIKMQLEEEQRIFARTVETEVAEEPVARSLKPWELIQEAREKWKERELKHMQQVILEKKGLKKDDLEKQREPILKLRQDAERKKKRLRDTLKMQQSIFEHTRNLFFPTQQSETRKVSLPPVRRKTEIAEEDSILAQEVMDLQRVDPSEEIIYHFMETQAKVLADLQKNPFQHSFDWRKILEKGRTRRATMDVGLRKLSRSKRISKV
ncbi:WD repeat-containing protein 63-like [Ceratina calcarata]|uniref:WD repeat-containing protein 63-like n=1 Tax=Ceratina calcarata TaxID=156304 RepID=A0AAJ7WFS0_9HYME|nr:WD repeat-containing protein 63-like [Ceratina calcarata]